MIRIPPSVQISNENLATSLNSLITTNIDAIVDDHISKYQIPYCTYGVDRNLLAEIEAVNQHSKLLNQNCANFEIMDSIKRYNYFLSHFYFLRDELLQCRVFFPFIVMLRQYQMSL